MGQRNPNAFSAQRRVDIQRLAWLALQKAGSGGGGSVTLYKLGASATLTLADGTVVGQQAWIEDNLGTAQAVQPVISGTFISGPSIQFGVNYQSVICRWDGSAWGLF